MKQGTELTCIGEFSFVDPKTHRTRTIKLNSKFWVTSTEVCNRYAIAIAPKGKSAGYSIYFDPAIISRKFRIGWTV